MFSGKVKTTTSLKLNGVRFESVELEINEPCVTFAEVKCENGRDITTVIFLVHVPFAHAIEDMARIIHQKAILRLVCLYNLEIGETASTVSELKSESNDGNDIMIARGVVGGVSVGRLPEIADCSPKEIKCVIENTSFKSDIYFELFNQARHASNDIVEFLGYYQIISSILNDPSQQIIDRFLIDNDPNIPAPTQKPNSKTGILETIYTRLRNEIAHVRTDAVTGSPTDIKQTKNEITQYVDGLRRVAVIAIRTTL